MDKTTSRIIGYDVARALAIFGMVIVNFKTVMYDKVSGPDWLLGLVNLFEGRAAAMFVILAGVGMTLMSKRSIAESDFTKIKRIQNTLIKRSFFLFIVGLLYTPIWPADILHFYGLYIIVGTFLLIVTDKKLWFYSLVILIISYSFLIIFNYEAGWDWITLTYTDLWTLQGMLRHLFFNGFHPVFPWIVFLIIGIWLGRQNLNNSSIRRKIIIVSFIVFTIVEIFSFSMTNILANGLSNSESEIIQYLFGTKPMPPTPFYILSAGATSFIVIVLCVTICEKFANSKLVKMFTLTGQNALTLYVAHVVVGMGLLEVFDLLFNQSINFTVITAMMFYLIGIIFSVYWLRKYKRGPLEILMRKIT